MEVLRYTAFSSNPGGGNRAGVVLDATGASEAEMQALATDIAYPETAFLMPRAEDGAFNIRYFSPLAEVPFCGHATIATAVAHADRNGPGRLMLHTSVGEISVDTSVTDGRPTATMTSVEPATMPLPEDDLDELLEALRWERRELDPSLPPKVAFAGNLHPIVAVATRGRLAALEYDYDRLGSLMAARNWTTADLVYREKPDLFHARNPFPPGGVVDDPATGAAAAALGGYLREVGAVHPPATITILQGADIGRPSMLTVDIPTAGGIRVSGTAVPVTADIRDFHAHETVLDNGTSGAAKRG